MLLDMSEIVIRDGMHVELDLDQPGVEDPDLVFVEPLKGRLSFDNGGDLIMIHGNVSTVLQQQCGRCLTETRVPVKLQVEEHFPVDQVLQPDKPPSDDAGLDTVVSSVVYLDQGRPILDLDELLRQLIVAEVPITTLCSENCAGLCPTCGVNRNETRCACADEARNTPLAGLGALLKQQENGQ